MVISSAPAIGTMPKQTANAMAPVVEAMKEALKNASPEEANVIQQQLQALQGQNSSSNTGVVTKVTELWSKIGDTCN